MTKYIVVQCLRIVGLAKKLEKDRLSVLETAKVRAWEIESLKAKLEEVEKTLKARDNELLDLNGASFDVTARAREAWETTEILRGKVANLEEALASSKLEISVTVEVEANFKAEIAVVQAEVERLKGGVQRLEGEMIIGMRPLCNAQPSPGYYPSSSLRPIKFSDGYSTLWGPEHQTISPDRNSVTIWLDRNSGSGFKSNRAYKNGYFGASIKLQSGYTAGVNTAFYLSNNQAYPGFHDEVDIEFLGNVAGNPYILQTNVYVRGSGDGRIIGREVRFHLWFDPTAGFHHYAILWNPDEIIFFVDDVPIRRYGRKTEATFPDREMWMYGTIWDASDWATEGGRYRADYRYQPFVSRFTRFKIGGCAAGAASCRPMRSSPGGGGLSAQQYAAMRWAQSNYMVYDYCQDFSRDHSLTPEC
ncbi:putative xyloglucan endotransglucosylase/hydrolase protein 32 [Canna indica]|uniref:xyloglucan:xyloglucosyl transferase n=1 Tax=Canna indica TaxID=4628 RepID=A0AAQ3KPJ1_9LILI|nr:putative xyloglucan endotransglucosylase/hydrolase protein 32 [Canna indica]